MHGRMIWYLALAAFVVPLFGPHKAPELAGMAQPISAAQSTINDAAWSPDGRWLAVATSAGLEVYDTVDSASGPRILIEAVEINNLVFSPAGDVLAAGNDGLVHAWNVATGDEIYQLPHEGAVVTIDISADGSRLVSSSATMQTREDNQVGYSDPVVTLWDMESKAVIQSMRLFSKADELQFFDEDRRVALQTERFDVLIWDMNAVPIWMDTYGLTVAWSLHPISRQIAMSSHVEMGDRHVQDLVVADTQTGEYVAELNVQDDWRIDTVAYNPAGDLLLTISNGGRLRIRRADTLEVLVNLTDTAETVAFSADGQHMAVGGRDGGVRLFSAPVLNSSGQVFIETGHVLFGTVGTVAQVEFSPDSRRVAAVFQDNTVGLWDVVTGEALAEYRRGR